MRKYLEISSTYRDRTMYPNPGYFEVPISQTGSRDAKNALDPVCMSTPSLSFNGSFRNDVASPTIDVTLPYANPSNTIENVDALTTIIIESALGQLRREKNFYKGAVVEFTQTISSITTSVRRRIYSYEFLSTNTEIPTSDQAYITFDVPLPDGMGVTASATGSITSPTDFKLTNSSLIYLPYAVYIDGHYHDYYIYNVDLNEYKSILYYDSVTSLAKLDSPSDTWQITHNYVIRKEKPIAMGSILSSTINSITINSIYTPNPGFIGSYVRITSPLPSYPLSDPSQYGEMRRIIGYDGKTITVCPSFSAIPVSGDGSGYEVLGFSYDNAQPFVYSGSTVSQQEMVCYEIELNDLILPNVTLAVGAGGLVAFYPYVYVELQNVSASGAGISNVIYSNNPNSTKMMFRCAIDDIQSPLISRFVKIDSDGMIVSLKFKINDNLRFSVRLPNGEIFETIEQDTAAPYPPNPLLQISCMFTLRKVA